MDKFAIAKNGIDPNLVPKGLCTRVHKYLR
jgi:hypothetical protein